MYLVSEHASPKQPQPYDDEKLLPPRTAGEYYVSFNGLDKETKRKAYKHQNWYVEKVKQIQVSGFNNIDHEYEIGLAQRWSFRDFM
jgi:hypothetical protein